eukprot:scaffold143610_cov21-Tisochrysis_lutea.AAC.1
MNREPSVLTAGAAMGEPSWAGACQRAAIRAARSGSRDRTGCGGWADGSAGPAGRAASSWWGQLEVHDAGVGLGRWVSGAQG